MKGIIPVACAGMFAAGTFALSPERVPYLHARSHYEAHVDLAAPERERIQAHLAETEAHLRANPPEGLTPAQMKNRLARLDDLQEYWTRGEFPKNRDFPDRLIPYFIDEAGVPCAMGHLVIQSGGGAFAEEIRARMNNAYIAEIAAADGRLAAWAKEQGMTLEEAARVQPGYGPPRLGAVWRVETEASGKPWVSGPDHNNIGGVAILYQDSSEWKPHSPGFFEWAMGFCVAPSGQALSYHMNGYASNGRAYTVSSSLSPSGCDWASDGTEAWIGTRQGLLRLRHEGASDTLAGLFLKTPLASDTVTGVAVTADAVWAATPRGAYRRGRVGNDTSVTAWDSTAIWGKRVTGLKPSGTRVWLGIEGASSVNGAPAGFSTRGLRRYNGSGWSAYVASQSSIQTPGDTIYALAERDTGSIWVATPAFGFARFDGTTTVKVADIPSGVTVYDMAGDATGFYAGTNHGLYRYTGDSLISLGQPAVSIRGIRAQPARGSASRLRVDLGPNGGILPAHTVLGRKTGSRTAAGIYVIPSSSP